jgi:hypothetical protein
METLWKKRTTVIYSEDTVNDVAKAREMVASMIDYANYYMHKEDPEAKRLVSLAMTSFEEWLMRLVKWITK